MLPAIILFAITYVLMLVFSKYRPYIAIASGIIFVVSGILPPGNILGSIDFNVILMIGGLEAAGVIGKAGELLASIGGMASTLGAEALVPLYFGLLSGATLGGNCTPIGASANIAGIGILRKEGFEVKNKDFFKIGIPFTLAAIIPAYIYIWLVFGI